jgi:hypothetical protein
MSEENRTLNRRSLRRRTLKGVVNVVNRLNEQVIGRLVNITTEGLMLVSAKPLETDTLYQVVLALPEQVNGVQEILLGMDCLWTSPADPKADMYWSGCHIIDLSDEMFEHLSALIEEFGD